MPKPTRSLSHSEQRKHLPPEFEPTGNVFSIGDRGVSYDVRERGERRLFLWMYNDEDFNLAKVAGWAEMLEGIEDGVAYLNIPEGTRSARSILGGLEAWPGEKRHIIDFMADYKKKVQSEFELYDATLSLKTIARTKDGRFFVTPPHDLILDTVRVEDHKTVLAQELDQVLLRDENHDELVAYFDARFNGRGER